jgi:hypothetical protein
LESSSASDELSIAISRKIFNDAPHETFGDDATVGYAV